MRAVHIIVSGRVQGVGFRQFARSRAVASSLRGWVRNLPDGNVECHAEGEEAGIEGFLADLRRGPLLSRVDAVRFEPVPAARHEGFEITR